MLHSANGGGAYELPQVLPGNEADSIGAGHSVLLQSHGN